MIKSITLKNFFSFEEQTVRLNPKVNLLVGINGSGKSNFIKAFELLRFGINEGTVHTKINDWGGMGKVRNFANREAEKIGLELVLNSKAYAKETGEDLQYELSTTKGGDLYVWMEKVSKGENEKIEVVREKALLSGSQLLDIEWVTGNHEMEMFENFLRQIVIYETIDTTENGVKKTNKAKRNGEVERLSQDFKNLADLLHSMSKSPKRRAAFEEIEKVVNRVNINFKGIRFKITNGFLEMLVEDVANKWLIGVENLSDGTLKFITLMSVLYNPNRGNIVCLEEPEDGLHPDMINMLAEGIKHASQTSQIIVSTHSPFLLNSFELEDVLVFENKKNNNTIVTELSQKDFGEWKYDFTVGQAWLNGLIGGTRW